MQNVSPDEDALDVEVIVNVLDASGRILETDSNTYGAIPAGATYYGGGDAMMTAHAPVPPGSTNPRWVEDSARRASDCLRSRTFVLPKTSSGANVLGEVMNASTRSLSSLARITIVCFDAGGNVIGGGSTFPPGSSDIPPGARFAFDASIEGLSALQIASAPRFLWNPSTRARSSAEPSGWPRTPHANSRTCRSRTRCSSCISTSSEAHRSPSRRADRDERG